VLIAYEATIDEHGVVRLLEPPRLSKGQRAVVVILHEESASGVPDAALLSEQALEGDWNRPEEDDAWAHLQQANSY
jgi:hypothetical protein|tara:strand:- start:10076 stop:10303 length:228 start_codon:yes stop_codon:yes gene_type:complete